MHFAPVINVKMAQQRHSFYSAVKTDAFSSHQKDRVRVSLPTNERRMWYHLWGDNIAARFFIQHTQ